MGVGDDILHPRRRRFPSPGERVRGNKVHHLLPVPRNLAQPQLPQSERHDEVPSAVHHTPDDNRRVLLENGEPPDRQHEERPGRNTRYSKAGKDYVTFINKRFVKVERNMLLHLHGILCHFWKDFWRYFDVW